MAVYPGGVGVLDLLIPIAAAIGGMGVTAALWAVLWKLHKTPVSPVVLKKPHEHRYTVMRSDGLWRCGLCDKPKRKGT